MSADLIQRLEKWVSFKAGDIPPNQGTMNWQQALQADIKEAIIEIKLQAMEHITEVTATNEVREILIEICNYPAALIALPRPLLDRLEAEAAIAKENKEP